jgi:hypothetical protein
MVILNCQFLRMLWHGFKNSLEDEEDEYIQCPVDFPDTENKVSKFSSI